MSIEQSGVPGIATDGQCPTSRGYATVISGVATRGIDSDAHQAFVAQLDLES